MKILRKLSSNYVFTIILVLLMSFIVITSISSPLFAGSCAVGGCDCGNCENCTMSWGPVRIPFTDAYGIGYMCSCEGGMSCEGIAF